MSNRILGYIRTFFDSNSFTTVSIRYCVILLCGTVVSDGLDKQPNSLSITYLVQSICDIAIPISLAIATYSVAKEFVVIDLDKWFHWTVLSLVATVIVTSIMSSYATVLIQDFYPFQEVKSSFIFFGISQLCYELRVFSPALLVFKPFWMTLLDICDGMVEGLSEIRAHNPSLVNILVVFSVVPFFILPYLRIHLSRFPVLERAILKHVDVGRFLLISLFLILRLALLVIFQDLDAFIRTTRMTVKLYGCLVADVRTRGHGRRGQTKRGNGKRGCGKRGHGKRRHGERGDRRGGCGKCGFLMALFMNCFSLYSYPYIFILFIARKMLVGSIN